MNNLVIFLVVAVTLGYQGLGIEGANIKREELFKLDLIHFNDFHARFEETSTTSTKCSPPAPCIGGLPRLFTGIKQLRAQHPDSVVLNAGDSFQGTLWYNLLRWNVTQYFMNMLPLDAHTLGNHEFDNGISGLVPYLQNLKAKMLDCNIDDSLEPTIQGLYQDSLVIERKGRKIGIIGVILQTTNLMANTEKLKFTDEITAVKRVAEKLTEEGVDIIIVLSHCGIDVDRLIAAGAGPNIDLIVGGHTHTLLYPKGETPPNGVALDDYPIAVNQSSGTTVLIVQASAYTKYLGFLEIFFDSNGKVNNWNGRPIYLDASIEQDQEIVKLMEPYKTQVDALGKRVLGTTNVQLDKGQCYSGECNIGNFITDAFVNHLIKGAEPGYWAYAAACIIGQGGIRTNIEIGTITYEDLVIAQPFSNILQTFDIKGKYILEALEHGTSDSLSKDLFMGQYMVQVSGLNVVYNVTRPIGNRVVSATIRCAKCPLPATYSPIEPETKYRFAAPDFLGNGGDGFSMFADNRENIKNWGVDIDILEEYIAKESPINTGLEGRITILK